MSLRYLLHMALLCLTTGGCLYAALLPVPDRLEVTAPAAIIFRRTTQIEALINPDTVQAQVDVLAEATAMPTELHPAVKKIKAAHGLPTKKRTRKRKKDTGTFIVRYTKSICPYDDCGLDFAVKAADGDGDDYGDPEKQAFVEHLLEAHGIKIKTKERGTLYACPLDGKVRGLPFRPMRYPKATDPILHGPCHPQSISHMRYHLRRTLCCDRFRCPDCDYSTEAICPYKIHQKKEHGRSEAEINQLVAGK